jgi:hypothetical protein
MSCPLCVRGRARRACPAVGRQICTVCCGTKRLVEIACPNDCPYLATSREHPPAALVRRQQRDVGALERAVRDLGERQAQLFFVIHSFLDRYEAPEFQALVDDDVIEAMAALAGTYETAARGVIYVHRPAALSADRLATALRPVIVEAGKHAGSAFDRDAAVVLRRIEETAREVAAGDPSNRRAYLDLIGRVLQADKEADATGGVETPRLIVP